MEKEKEKNIFYNYLLHNSVKMNEFMKWTKIIYIACMTYHSEFVPT